MRAKVAFFPPGYDSEGLDKLVLELTTKHNEYGPTRILPVGAERDQQYFRVFGRFILAGSSRKRGQTSTSPAAPTKKPLPASGGGDQDAADAVVAMAAAAAGDSRVPDSSSQGTGPAAGALRAVAGDATAAPAPTEVRVFDLTGFDDDALAEVASVGALQQSAPAPAEAGTAVAGNATQAAPSVASGTEQPPPAGAGGGALEKPPSPQSAPLDGQGAAGLGQAGGASSNPNAPSGSQTVAAGSSSSAGATFSSGAGELAGRSWGRITFDPSVFQQGQQVANNIQQQQWIAKHAMDRSGAADKHSIGRGQKRTAEKEEDTSGHHQDDEPLERREVHSEDEEHTEKVANEILQLMNEGK
ncbi:uncharacterized protein LOC104582195 [Brachypodium distachyon]|uniref:uncharacterized protein LOC104582195 n=1 Tax=Brachypodium distachyon TaxID=15368 RepID=UPI00052FF345|nr:uncharacterized protein LOC104582195 [Brachypodium distachyon]|eukprot:XP_010229855.1 uncharacterized protein LOC104582195 [Brachypodium distachyon]